MTEGAISELVLKLTQLYIPNCVGFGPHSSRHIIGTELAKNEPYGIDIAAGVLHITKKTAEDHYARTTPKDKVKRWLDHYERLKKRRKSESGAMSRGKKTA
jgi:integrase